MCDLIYFFDGGGRWVLQLAVCLILAVVALWLMFDKKSAMWEDADEDERPERT